MAYLRILQVITDPLTEEEVLKLLPGAYANHRECAAAIKEDGEYFFLEAHHLTKPETDGQQNNG